MGFEIESLGTVHSQKNRRGKAWDWLLWKTPLRHWSRRLRWQEVSLDEVLERIRDHGDPNSAKHITDELLYDFSTIKVWEQYRLSSPYELMDVRTILTPDIPMSYVKCKLTLVRKDDETPNAYQENEEETQATEG